MSNLYQEIFHPTTCLSQQIERFSMEEGRSLDETPTWAVASVVTTMVTTVFLFTSCLDYFAKWLQKTKRRSLSAALDKIKEELMVVGVLSLLMGHWSIFVAKICIESSEFSTRFYPCIPETESTKTLAAIQHVIISNYSKDALAKEQDQRPSRHDYCAEGYESLASYESLEQLHRLLFVLAVTHVTYSSLAVALAIIKIYSWRSWENEAKSVANQISQDYTPGNIKLRRLCTFIVRRASHPWSQHKVLVWPLCFSRQFWSSIHKSDYIALRFGFVTTHQLPLSYDFLNYMLRSMEEEFRDIVGVSVPLWMYAIFCIFLDFHGSNVYFWLSFLPAIIIMIIGTKLHRIVVKLAIEIIDASPCMKNREFELRDELFWFRKPRLLLRLIQFISFQNAFEMAMFLWSLWEIRGTSCFMKNPSFMVIRLTFGIVSQVWCSFITFPLYVIITQMGSRFKRTVISEGVRRSLHGWQNRVKTRQNKNSNARLSSASSMPLMHNIDRIGSSSKRHRTSTSSGKSLRSEGSSKLLHDNMGVLFTSHTPSYVDEEWNQESSDGYGSSDHYDEKDDRDRDDRRYFHLP